MSLRKRLAVSAFLVLGGGLGVWFWQSNTGLIPPSSEKPSAGTSTDVPDRGRSVSAAGPEGAQGNRTEARSPVVSPAAPQEPVPEWLSGATLLSGGLSAAEVAVARSYVGPLMESAAAELDALKVDSESGEDLAEQARIIRDLELWRAVDLSLRRGSFRVAKSVPADLQAPSGVQLQLLPTWKDEKSVSLVFAFKRSEEPGLFDANSYEAQMVALQPTLLRTPQAQTRALQAPAHRIRLAGTSGSDAPRLSAPHHRGRRVASDEGGSLVSGVRLTFPRFGGQIPRGDNASRTNPSPRRPAKSHDLPAT
jgi:hypothetical protein